jgi:threonine aldolase
MRRRTFFEFSAALLAQTPVTHAAAGPRIVDFIGDGIPLDAVAYAELLTRLAAEKKAEVDFYGRGETVAALERHMASLLGKERAVFFPTGTMANRVALQTLAGPRRRVLVGAREPHL